MVEPLRTMLEIITKYFLELTKPGDVNLVPQPQDSDSMSSSQSTRNNDDASNLINPAADRPTSSSYGSGGKSRTGNIRKTLSLNNFYHTSLYLCLTM